MNRGENLKGAIILRMMIAGAIGMVVRTATGSFLCLLQTPIDFNTCVQITGSIWKLLFDAQIVPIVAGSISGLSVFLLSGKWIKNN